MHTLQRRIDDANEKLVAPGTAVVKLPVYEVQIERDIVAQDAIRAEAPEVDAQVAIYLRAWRNLDSARLRILTDFGLKSFAVPWTAIDRWAEREGLDYDTYRLLVDVISILDADMLGAENERLALAAAAAKKR